MPFSLIARTVVLTCILSLMSFGLKAQNPIELGQVNWLRNYDNAIIQAKDTDKAIFILFQEVPGCITCQRYGKNVLSHPLIVEAIEELFVPLAIHNNKQGEDAEILKKYNEPSWNNPVVRIVDEHGETLKNRLTGGYDKFDVVSYMIDNLVAENREVPGYLTLLRDQFQAEKLGVKETFFSMYCFWSGEKNIAKTPGVIYTEAGFMGGKEVVKVQYAPALVEYETLLDKANKAQCASGAFTNDVQEQKIASDKLGNGQVSDERNYRKDSEDKYYLYHSDIRFIPLTKLQKSRINSMLGEKLNPSELLSPRQLSMLDEVDVKKSNSLIAEDFDDAWQRFQKEYKINF